MAKQNNLTMNKIKKQYKKIHEKADYELKDGLNINFYPIFPEGKVDELMEHMAAQFKYAEEKGIEISEPFMLTYVNFLAIKFFTHLSKDISDNFEEQLSQMEWLIDTGYFKQIVEEVFMNDQIQKIFDKAVELTSKFVFLEKLTQQMQNSVQNLELNNANMITQLGNKVVQ